MTEKTEKIDPRLAGLSPAKRALLLRMLAGQKPPASGGGSESDRSEAIPALPRRAGEENPFPASFAQQRVWFVEQMMPGTTMYNFAFVLRFDGRLDPDALERSLSEVVRRHEVLRTRFERRGGELVQVVRPHTPVALARRDLTHLAKDAQEEALRRLALEEARTPFDLAEGRLLRGTLLACGPDAHVLLLSTHHIVSDAWSLGVLSREVLTLYPAFARGRPSPLEDLPIQYADFAVWQRGRMTSGRVEPHLAHWRQKLADLPVTEITPDLAAEKERRTGRGAHEVATIPEGVVRRLKELAKKRGTTLYVVLLAAYAVLLQKYTRTEEVVVGSATAGRTQLETEGLLGFFVNGLVLRIDLSRSPSFEEAIDRARDVVLEADAHQEAPFEKLVEELAPQRSAHVTPLFQSLFLLQTVPIPKLVLDGVTVTTSATLPETSRFDLYVSLEEGPSGELVGTWEYAAELFAARSIARLAEHYGRVIDAVLVDPSRAIDDLSLATSEEVDRMIVAWNATATPFPRTETVHALFEAQADRTPDLEAVVYGTDSITYAELDRRANQLARHLRDLGAAPGTFVGVRLERSVAMVTTFLAILKTGAAYVPLDLSYPEERIEMMLANTKAAVVVATSDVVPRVWDGIRVVLLDRDADRARIAEKPGKRLGAVGDGGSVAYVVYTSGSTGEPKGIVCLHRGVNRTCVATNYVELGPGDRVAQGTNVSFDIATIEIWGALLNGGTVVGVGRDVLLSPRLLVQFLREERITTYFMPTGLLVQILREDPKAFASLRTVAFGGEVIPPHWLRTALAEGPPARLVNGYGPSEVTVFATWQLVRDVPPGERSIPVGRPIANTQVYVLDRAMRPVPPTMPGEIWIGGDGLARGYLDRPEQTERAFVKNPFPGTPGDRLYRTGDVGRFREDGTLEFLGRADNQVKYRGFRIELGEIESTLARHPRVEEATVLMREDSPGDKRLVAYVVPRPTDADVQTAGAGHVSLWTKLFEDFYRQPSPEADPTFNTIGWKSAFTGEAIPHEEMREWLDDTIANVEAAKPKEVLEIGSGTGMILFRIAPSCTRYVALDISEESVAYVRREWERLHPGDDRVQVLRREADDLAGLEPASFDTVVLNSIVQFFPTAEYLTRVLEGAARLLRPGGRIFIGDVRSLPLLPAYHAAIELAREGDGTTLDVLRERVRLASVLEKELVVAPAFFQGLKERIGRLAGIRITPKRGAAMNELTQFRYGVHLQLDRIPSAPEPDSSHDWPSESLTLDRIRQLLAAADAGARTIRIARIPNARVASAVEAARVLGALVVPGQRSDADPPKTVDALRKRAEAAARAAVAPDDVARAGHDAGFRCELSWQEAGASFDARFYRGHADGLTFDPPHPRGAAGRRTNDPILADAVQHLVPELKADLADQLPEFMVPRSFVLLDSMPRNANGKVDRRALPAPDRARGEADRPFVGPRDEVEAQLTKIWEDALGIRPIGVHDDFFDLGGHSLLAVRLVADIERSFGREIPFSALFEARSIANLAPLVRGTKDGGARSPIVPLREAGTKTPIFFIHPAGGSVFCYAPLAELLDPERPFYGIEAMGIEPGQEPLERLDEMADVYTAAIAARRPHGPYLLGGWSFGGPVALEIAARLVARGERVDYVALLDIGAPDSIKHRFGEVDDTRALANFARDAGVPLLRSEDELRRMDLDAQLRYVISRAEAEGQIPPGMGIAQLRRFVRCARLNIEMIRAHTPRSYAGKVGLFRATEVLDPSFGHEDPVMGWQRHLARPVELRRVPGHHGSILQPPNLAVLAAALRDCFDRAEA